MTKRHLLTVSITDIKALEVRCNKCEGLISFPLGYNIPNFVNCPGCGANLWDAGPTYNALDRLYGAFVEWSRVSQKPLDLTFSIELPDEDSRRSVSRKSEPEP
jgi:hypothetical protein